MLLPIILSGGVGSRLWPLSREAHPKPFIKLGDGQSLLQKSYIRACSISDSDEVVTVTNRDLFFYSKDEFEEIGVSASKNTFLLEPVGRNSAAAIAIAAHYAHGAYGPDCTMLIMPADHLVHRHTHRVVRGSLFCCGRPDGRLSVSDMCPFLVLFIVCMRCGTNTSFPYILISKGTHNAGGFNLPCC